MCVGPVTLLYYVCCPNYFVILYVLPQLLCYIMCCPGYFVILCVLPQLLCYIMYVAPVTLLYYVCNYTFIIWQFIINIFFMLARRISHRQLKTSRPRIALGQGDFFGGRGNIYIHIYIYICVCVCVFVKL
jgi:hypothetical protein